jgi:membrane-bound lytic murein transglycosylase B
VNIKRVNGGLQFWERYADDLQRAEMEFGVPQEIIVALIGVETVYGKNRGRFTTFDALATLAFDYPRRATFFRGELEQYLLLSREQEFDLTQVQGSYAGALGIPQFMPSSYRKYALDYDNDGRIDLLNDPVDAIGSVANYLRQYGWVGGGEVAVRASVSDEMCVGSIAAPRSLQDWSLALVNAERPMISGTMARLVDFTVPEGKEFWFAFGNFDVITRYNNSDYYAMTVFQLAEALRAARASNGAQEAIQSAVMRRAPL